MAAPKAPTTPAPVIEKAAEATSPVEESNEEFNLDNKEVSRILTVIRYRLNEAVRDARRARPVLSRSQAEAQGKAKALVRALREFSEQTF